MSDVFHLLFVRCSENIALSSAMVRNVGIRQSEIRLVCYFTGWLYSCVSESFEYLDKRSGRLPEHVS